MKTGSGGRSWRWTRPLWCAALLLVALAVSAGAQQRPMPRYLNSLPAYSPDGNHIAFASTRDSVSELYVVRADGTGARRLTNNADQESRPVWSPDGTRIYYDVITRVGNTRHAAPHVVDIGTAEAMPLAEAPGPGVTASAQGAVVFTAGVFPRNELHLRVPGDGTARRISPDGVVGFWPSWSPRGDRLAFTTFVPNEQEPARSRIGIAVVAADGTGFRALLPDTMPGETPAWFPDGSRIAFQSRVAGNYDIWAVNVDGTGLVQLTRAETLEEVPSVSPDGRAIVFQSDRSGEVDLWIMDADGSNARKLLQEGQ